MAWNWTKTIHWMWDDWIEVTNSKKLSTWCRVTIPVAIIDTKEIVKDITPGVWKPNEEVLKEWDSNEYKEKLEKSWKPSNW